MNFTKVKEALRRRGYAVSCFETGKEAADYLNHEIDGVSVGFGGSMTLKELGLYEKLCAHNTVLSHWNAPENVDAAEMTRRAAASDVYLCSANALAETGEILNIDGTGNRISSMLYGHKKVYFVIGKNKIAPDYEGALWRARNIAAPKNAKRLNRKTPCVADGRSHDCSSPERICRGLAVLWEKMGSCEMEVVLIDEDLGY